MNRIYRLVWNRALRTVQVASELASAQHAQDSSGVASTRRRPLALAITGLLLAVVALPAWADCTPTNVIDCAAPGGFNGHPGRNMHGGAGDGNGGNATQRDTGGTVEVSGDATNNGAGGRGADGIENNTNPVTVAAGGAGGAVGATGSAALGATITGGSGQAGTSPPVNVDFWAGGGGGGGAGVFVNDASSVGHVVAGTVITGGAGGNGGDINAVPNGDAGGGGGGGAGVIVGASASNASIAVDGRVVGGSGGNGGNLGYAGSGGGGGDALLALGSGASIMVNTGATLQGGTGGLAGIPSPANPPNGGGYAGGYGGGGAGANLVGAGSVLNNAGSIIGGSTGGSGVAGVGVRAWGGAGVTTSGHIAGGLDGDGAQADAVLFSGGGNLLTIVAGATFVGDIESISGTANGGDALSLNGSSNGSINAGQIIGFATNRKDGSGTWTLTGTAAPGTNWTIRSGVLAGDTDSLAGNITFNPLVGTPSVDFNQQTSGTFLGVISGGGAVSKDGPGTLTLAGVNTYTGVTLVNSGTLALASGASIGSSSGVSVASGGTLDLSAAGNQSLQSLNGVGGTVDIGGNALTLTGMGIGTFGGTIIGSGSLIKSGVGTQILIGSNLYTGGTTITAGTLLLGAGVSLAANSTMTVNAGGTLDVSAAGNLSLGTLNGSGGQVQLGSTTLSVDGGTYNGVIAGAGGLVKAGSGTLTLNGINSYGGTTQVTSGSLLIGDATHTSASVQSDVAVSGAGSLGGFGTVNGDVSLTSGGTLAPGGVASLGTLTVDGNLTIGSGTQLNFDFGAPGPNFSTPGQSDRVVVTGNLSIDASTLNVNNIGSMGPGLYNLFQWGGTFQFNNGGFTPPPGMALQVLSTDKQINLIDTLGVTLNLWNANGLASPSSMGGGSGTWSLTASNWTDTNGDAVGPMSPVPGFAIFGGASGTVTVDNTDGGVSATGMQFVSDGYRLTGDALTLVGQNGDVPIIRVSAGATAIIDSLIDSNNGINKTDAGTLVLNGANLYAGNTVLSGGELSVSSDLNLGLAANAVDFEGGTLQITGDSYHSTSRAILWGSAGGGFDIADASNTFTVSQNLGGTGGLLKLGAGTLVLTGTNSYTGGTTLAQGTLQGNSLSMGGDIIDDATLVMDQAFDGVQGGVISGTGALVKSGTGTLTLAGDNTYSGGTTILAGGLQGTTRSLQGAITDNGVLIVDQAFDGTFGSSVSGTGQLVKNGTGSVTLTGVNTYAGGTVINAGTLQGDTDSLQGSITDNAALAFAQNTDGQFTGIISGSGSVTKSGTGILALSGANTYSGGTTILGGTLQGDAASLQGAITNNATLAFLQSSDATFAGAISGTGQLVKAGAGTLMLSGANTYTGGTTIAAGVLEGDTVSLQGDTVNNATLAFAQTSDGTFAGTISGAGQLVKLGGGTLTLSAANTYSGGTTISAGTLKGDASSLQGNIVDNATLAFQQSTDGSFAGAVSGTGQLTKDGAGTLALTGANTYAGGTTVNAGTLQGDTTSLQGVIVDHAVVQFAQDTDGTFNGVINGAGQLVKSGAGTLTLMAGSTYGGGTLVVGGTLQGDTTSLQGAIENDARLVFSQGGDGVFDGTVSGNGQWLKNGAGTLILDGANTFSGTTEIAAGKLVVGDDSHGDASLAGSVTVDSGATLGGIGSIGALDLSGTLTPGNSIGTLHVAGNATFHPGSNYQFEVSPDGTGDSVAVSGSVAILGGSAVALANNGNWAPQTQFQIITAGGGITGQFDSLASSLAFLTPSLSYGANAVTLQLTRNDIHFDDIAQTRNQRAVAAAIEPLGMASPLYQAVVGLDAATARAGFDAMSGEQFASSQTALVEDSRYVRDAIDRHLLGLHNDGSQATDAQGVTAWTSAWGHWGNNDGDGNAARQQSDGSGLLVGADLGINGDARLGAVLGHRQITMRVDDRNADAHATATDLGLYGDVAFGNFSLRGALAYGWQQVQGSRSVAFGNISERLDDRYDAGVAHGFVEGSYRFDVSARQQLEPFLNLATVHIQTDASHESGGVAALNVAGANDTVNIATLGLRDVWSLAASGGIHAHAGIGWQQAWGDVTPVSTMRLASGSDSFAIAGTPVARHAGVIDAGLSFAVTRNAFVDASYVGQFGDSAKDQGARLSLNVLW